MAIKMCAFRSISVIIVLVVLLSSTSCRKRSIEGPGGRLIGSWQRVLPVSAVPAFPSYDTESITLTIKKNGTYEITKAGKTDEKGRIGYATYTESPAYWDFALQFQIKALMKKPRFGTGNCMVDIRGNDSLFLTQYQGEPYQQIHVFVRR
jgi:hypothetical protein